MEEITLNGTHVRLEPLSGHHLPGLLREAGDSALWEFSYSTNAFASRAFAITDAHTGDPIGSTRIFEIDERNRKFEIGWTFLFRRLLNLLERTPGTRAAE